MWWHAMTHGIGIEGGKLANAVGSQYPSHYLGTRCIQHYYRWCRTPRLPAVDWTDPPAHPDLYGLIRFARKTKSGFCACAITFQKHSTAQHLDCHLSHPTTSEFSKAFLVPAGWTASELMFRVPSLFPSSGEWNIGLFALGPRYKDASPGAFSKILKGLTNWLVGTGIHCVGHTCCSSLKFCEQQ